MEKKDNTSARALVTLTKSDKEKLEEISKEQNRSLSNLINMIIRDYLDRYLPPNQVKKK